MRYYLIAGEASGDLHGSNLIRGLVAEDPSSEFRFWGGDKMNDAAQSRPHQLVVHYKDGAVMGATDVIAKAGKLLDNLKMCKRDISAYKPDAVILIDYPGFNMQIAKFCHKNGIKTFYYIAPKTWASREGRNRKLKAWTDRLFIVFPFEKPYFESKCIPYVYEGNPLIDAIDAYQFSPMCKGDYIAILAGSRKSEISRMMPVCMEMADRMHAMPQYSSYKFIIGGAPARDSSDYAPFIGSRDYVSLVFNRTYDVLKYAKSAVINSGTASLESALIGTPQVVGWSTSPLTYFIGKDLLRVMDHIKFVSLGNLCLDRLAFKEFIQKDFTSDAILNETRRIIEDEEYRSGMLQDYADIRESLGGAGASRRVARRMVSILSGAED